MPPRTRSSTSTPSTARKIRAGSELNSLAETSSSPEPDPADDSTFRGPSLTNPATNHTFFEIDRPITRSATAQARGVRQDVAASIKRETDETFPTANRGRARARSSQDKWEFRSTSLSPSPPSDSLVATAESNHQPDPRDREGSFESGLNCDGSMDEQLTLINEDKENIKPDAPQILTEVVASASLSEAFASNTETQVSPSDRVHFDKQDGPTPAGLTVDRNPLKRAAIELITPDQTFSAAESVSNAEDANQDSLISTVIAPSTTQFVGSKDADPTDVLKNDTGQSPLTPTSSPETSPATTAVENVSRIPTPYAISDTQPTVTDVRDSSSPVNPSSLAPPLLRPPHTPGIEQVYSRLATYQYLPKVRSPLSNLAYKGDTPASNLNPSTMTFRLPACMVQNALNRLNPLKQVEISERQSLIVSDSARSLIAVPRLHESAISPLRLPMPPQQPGIEGKRSLSSVMQPQPPLEVSPSAKSIVNTIKSPPQSQKLANITSSSKPKKPPTKPRNPRAEPQSSSSDHSTLRPGTKRPRAPRKSSSIGPKSKKAKLNHDPLSPTRVENIPPTVTSPLTFSRISGIVNRYKPDIALYLQSSREIFGPLETPAIEVLTYLGAVKHMFNNFQQLISSAPGFLGADSRITTYRAPPEFVSRLVSHSPSPPPPLISSTTPYQPITS